MSTEEGEARRERAVDGIGSGHMAIFYTPLGPLTVYRYCFDCQPLPEHRRSTEQHAFIT